MRNIIGDWVNYRRTLFLARKTGVAVSSVAHICKQHCSQIWHSAVRLSAFGFHLSRLTSHVLPFTVCLFLSACRPSPQYQEHYNIPGGAWASGYQPQFNFDITDTAAAYQLILLIRHTDAYPFSNIWMNVDSRGPRDSGYSKLRVEVPLAAVSGQWLGRGMGELWEQHVAINPPDRPAFFPHKGRYTLRLRQDMRRDPLPEVLTIGLRLEKLPVGRKS